ncbi:MAG TPA: ABC transporter ATP-binding protein [Deltaproteobacteria bacterium]|nr:ABC transporter ATP-binding protein [Deltaproteobacteria bacterium]
MSNPNPEGTIHDVFYRYPGTSSYALQGISFSVSKGECLCITGPSGCGKSTLLLAISGLLKGGELTGEHRISHLENGRAIGIVFQNAESQILATAVQDEVAFGPTNMNLPGKEIQERVRYALEAVGLTGYETRNVEELSAGEKHRLTIAAVLSMEPSMLILDEPTAQLDGPGKEALREILKALKGKGYTIIVADHDTEPYRDIADRYLLMKDGRVEVGTEPVPWTRPGSLRSATNDCDPVRPSALGQDLVGLDGIYFSRPNGRQVIWDLSLSISDGERVHIWGTNGTGKSTLFKVITGLLRPDSGTLNVLGLSAPRPENLRGKVGLLLQNPVRQLFEDTVYAEVSFALKRQGLSPEEIRERTIDALSLCDVLHLRNRSPLTLSYGEKHRVTLASMIALRPQVLLLDEPFSGLDFAFRYKMLDILRDYGRLHGCAIAITSHDPMIDPDWADSSYMLQDGRLVQRDRI